MAKAGNSPSLRQIANDLSLSVAAVSMALRGHPEISQKTIERVTAAAAKVGYRTNPLLHLVMSRIRSANVRRLWLNFAFVWIDVTPMTVQSDPFYSRTIQSVSERAQKLGLHLEQFHLNAPGMTPERLEKILTTRGITGIIFSPSANIVTVDLRFDWDKFSVVVMGNVPWKMNFHRSGHHHYRGVGQALREVGRLGYRRPALVLKEKLNERADRAPEAAFLTHHPLPDQAARLVFHSPEPTDSPGFGRWIKQESPDCLIFPFFDAFAPRLDGVAIEGRYPYAGLDLVLPGPVAGVHYAFEAIGSNAVDLLITQMIHHERGVPKQAQIVFAEGAWQDGSSLPPRPAEPIELPVRAKARTLRAEVRPRGRIRGKSAG